MSADRVGGAVLNSLRNSLNILQGKIEIMEDSATSLIEGSKTNSRNSVYEIQNFTNLLDGVLGELRGIAKTLESADETMKNRQSKDSEVLEMLGKVLASNEKLLKSNNDVIESNERLKSQLPCNCLEPPLPPQQQQQQGQNLNLIVNSIILQNLSSINDW